MHIFLALSAIVSGIAMLIYGSDFLINNAAMLAKRFGVSTLFIGLTVVAFGTSAPELAASLVAALKNSPELAMGNVVGSNIANLSLVLGAAAFIYPLSMSKLAMRRDVPIMLVASLLLFPLSFDFNGDGYGYINRLEGLFLVLALITYVFYILHSDEDGEENEMLELVEELNEESKDASNTSTGKIIAIATLGMLLLTGGAQLLVHGATNLATLFGISKRIIGITIVALGTSLPELAASITAARQKHGDMILGNLIGSNIFNILSIIGITALVKPLAILPEGNSPDFWMMISVGVVVSILLFRNSKLSRVEGLLTLGMYVIYILYIYFKTFA